MPTLLPLIHGELHFHSCNTIISCSDFPSTCDTDTKAQTSCRWNKNFVISVLFCGIWSSNFLTLNNLPPNHVCSSFSNKMFVLSWYLQLSVCRKSRDFLQTLLTIVSLYIFSPAIDLKVEGLAWISSTVESKIIYQLLVRGWWGVCLIS